MSEEYRCPDPECNSTYVKVGKDTFRCLKCGIIGSKTHHCPRCKRKYLMDFGHIVECPICKREFEKADFVKNSDDDAILSLQKKQEIAKLLHEP